MQDFRNLKRMLSMILVLAFLFGLGGVSAFADDVSGTIEISAKGIGRARAELFENQIVQHGGQICPAQAPGVTHIVVDEGMDCERALRLLRLPQLPPGAQLVKSAWLSSCLQERRLVDTAGFGIFTPKRWAGPSLSSNVFLSY